MNFVPFYYKGYVPLFFLATSALGWCVQGTGHRKEYIRNNMIKLM